MVELKYELFNIENCLSLYNKGISCQGDGDNKKFIFEKE